LLSGKGLGTRKEFHDITDDDDYAAFGGDKWKISFLTRECNGFDSWDCEHGAHRASRITNLRVDSHEFGAQHNASSNCDERMFCRAQMYVPAHDIVGMFVKSFKNHPPRSLSASFSADRAMKMISTSAHN
jgi:hypothetical protein